MEEDLVGKKGGILLVLRNGGELRAKNFNKTYKDREVEGPVNSG